MKLIFIIFLIFYSILSVADTSFKLVHYNVKELDSVTLRQSSSQLNSVRRVLSQLGTPDIFSLNEIQYDMPGVFGSQSKTCGQNMKVFGETFYPGANFQSIFFPANTGMKAKKTAEGIYLRKAKTAEDRKLADPNNFGLFPGQYSTGGLTQFPIERQVVISELPWKTFSPETELSGLSIHKGNPYQKILNCLTRISLTLF